MLLVLRVFLVLYGGFVRLGETLYKQDQTRFVSASRFDQTAVVLGLLPHGVHP